MKLKKIGLAVMAATALFGLASCTGNSNTPVGPDIPVGPDTPDTPDTPNPPDDGSDLPEHVEDGNYTYNLYTTTFPSNWNPHTYQTATDYTILGYCSEGFYTFDYNETKDGYKIVADMATAEPTDVTAEYVGKYGVEEGDTAKVWSIPLRSDLKWNDGTPITAEDFVTSAKLLLNPAASNYRADSLYAGDLKIYNAKNYLFQGKSVNMDNNSLSTPLKLTDLTKDTDGTYKTAKGEKAYIALEKNLSWLGGKTLKYYVDGYGADYFVTDHWADLTALATDGLVPLTDESFGYLAELISNPAWGEGEGYEYNYFYIEQIFDDLDFEEVGITSKDNNVIVALENPLSGFYLLYALGDSWLVKEDLYKACESETAGVYVNTYGTSVDTFASYGPYVLTEFQLDKTFKLEKNPYFFGYNDEYDYVAYETTAIVYNKVADNAAALEMFEKGQVDSYGLSADDMATYSDSDYLYYTEGASTFFVALNPDFDGLKAQQDTATEAAGAEMNKTIFTIKEFRQALSYAINRKDFCLACDPTGLAAKAVFNNLIICNPEEGTAYRTLEASKDIVLEFWGLSDAYGPGKRYATKDEAIDSITGVDLTLAKEKFQEAYDLAIANNLMTADAKIAIKIGQPSTANFYVKGYDYLTKCWTDAVKGTSLEGKLVFSKDDTIGNGFADALKGNKVDVLFGVGWTGAALNPYSLISAYTDPSYQYDPSIDYSAEQVEIHFDTITDKDGAEYKDITLSCDALTWSREILSGTASKVFVVEGSYAANPDLKEITIACGTDCDLNIRVKILNAIEALILRQYTLLPLVDDASSSLKGMKVKFYTEEYVYGIGRGGVKYMRYYYTDEQWAEYVASQGGILNYK